LHSGTVTFLFTDIEESTRLLRQLGDHYADVLAEYRRLLRVVCHERRGKEVDTQGDACFVAFLSARNALTAAVAAQRAINVHVWPEGVSLRVRMGLHTGEALAAETEYVGMDVHRAARICAAGHGGQILVSQTTRDIIEARPLEGLILRDLGEHRLKDLGQAQHLYQIILPDVPSEFPPLKSLGILPNNLPVQLTSFVGRGREMAEVKRLLNSTRLLMLTGTGGSGKTRLALQVAAELLDQYHDGVRLVELAPLSDPTLIPQTVASTLGVHEEPGRPLTETLADFLRPKSLLLLLDNCEHLLSPCAQLVDVLLRLCPTLRILATSREALGITGETTYRLPSLSLPDVAPLPLKRLAQYEAVRLFMDRAAAALPTFKVTTQNAKAVATICQQLDGIPLAVELAAVRVKTLSVEHIAERLHDRFKLLTGGSRTAMPRHQTLRAALDWSFALLSEPERAMLRRLTVFSGGFTLEAAEAVCQGQDVNGVEVLDLLARLVEKSLVVFQESEKRYRLLETVRQYGREKLLESGEEAATCRKHRDWYLELAEHADVQLHTPRQRVWLDLLDIEHDNLRAALTWSTTAQADPEAGVRLAAALRWFWHSHGHYYEARQWLERAQDAEDGVSASARARALNTAGLMAWRQADFGRAETLIREALALAQKVGDKSEIALALHQSAHIEEMRGSYGAATTLFEESVALYREVKDQWGLASTLACFGDTKRSLGEYERAVQLYEESMALYEGPVYGRAVSISRLKLGIMARIQGDYDRASGLLREALTLIQESGNQMIIASCLVAIGEVAGGKGQPERAVRLYGAAERLREVVGVAIEPTDRADYDRNVDSARDMLGEKAFEVARADGRAMTQEQAVEYALSDT